MGQLLTGRVVGVDAGGTKVKVGLSDKGNLMESSTFPTEADRGGGQCFDRICSEIMRLRQVGEGIEAIGIASPGVVDPSTKQTYLTWNIPGWDDLDIARRLEALFEVPIAIENDANMAAIGEAWYGDHGASFLFLAIGTGLGSGLILDQKLWTGRCGAAGEIGKWIMSPDAVAQTFNYGHLELLVSGWGIENLFQGRTGVLLSAREIFGRMQQGDPVARSIFDDSGRALGIAVANVSNLLSLDAVVLGGGVVMPAPDFWISHVRTVVREHCISSPLIRSSVLGENAVLMGAIVEAHHAVPRDDRKSLS